MKMESLNLTPDDNQIEIDLFSREVMAELKESLRDKIDPSGDPEHADQVVVLINMKIAHLRKTYSDWKKYQSFYLLTGEPVLENITKIDFPGNDSIVTFIDNL